jgi:uncharacterized peroxidase-related enzyme
LTNDPELVETLMTDYRAAPLESGDRAMLDYVVKLTREPWSMEKTDVRTLRKEGFSDEAILDIVQVTGYYAFANRLADGLGIELETDSGDSS